MRCASHAHTYLTLTHHTFHFLVTGRLFLGMHSVPDLIGGLFFAAGCMATYVCFDYALEDWMVHSVGALFMPTLLSLAMLLLYPHPKEFSPA